MGQTGQVKIASNVSTHRAARTEQPDRPNEAPGSNENYNLTVQPDDAAGQGARLAALEADPSTFADGHHPVWMP